jgi:putative chitinase
MMYDRDVYFAAVRDDLFSGALSQEQVDGQSVILAVWEHQGGGTPMEDERWLAYMLATTFHETAEKMWPIEEYGRGAGHPYGKPDPDTGETYYGRGFVQLTWRENYAKASKILSLYDTRDLEWHAWMALDSLIATRVLFRGMAEGWFTGRQLGDYFNDEKDDPVNARQIINGNDKDTLIADYHYTFLGALNAAEITTPKQALQTVVIDIQAPSNVQVAVHVNDAEYGT